MKYLLIAIFFPLFLSAQNEDAQWIFGGGYSSSNYEYQSAVLDFRSGQREVYHKAHRFGCVSQNVSICDENGDILLYSNGADIFNWNDSIVENGGDFFEGNNNDRTGLPLPQTNILLKWPDDINKYLMVGSEFIYYFGQNYSPIANSPLHYSIIDIDSNIEGEVIIRKENLFQDTIYLGKLTAVKHANGRDWWIVAMDRDEISNYYFFLFDPIGIKFSHFQSIDKSLHGGGQSAFSPDGNWYACTQWSGIIGQGDTVFLDLYNVDRCTGQLSNYHFKNFGDNIGPTGVAFSPNSELMYVTIWDSIFQYDLTADDIFASEQVVQTYQGAVDSLGTPLRYYLMGLAPDDKIYISVSNYNAKYLHVIDSPNVRGVGCAVREAGVKLPVYNNWVMPNLPNPRLGALVGSPCDTLGSVANEEPIKNEVEVRVFPNPSSDYFSINYSDFGRDGLRLRLFDVVGRLRGDWVAVEQNQKISVQMLEDGIYFYQLEKQNGDVLGKGKLVVSK